MKESLDFFKIQHNNLHPTRGRALIAEPFLQDAYFKRSVVLITEHDNKGTVGFVLNNPVEFRINEMLKGFPLTNSIVSVGGPVHTDTIHYLHSLGPVIPECVEILDQVYWGGDIEVIKSGIKDGWIKDYQIRFFVGYSSWHPGQLDREIKENSWLVTEIDPLDVMHGSDIQLWKSILAQKDIRYQMWTRYPEDPAAPISPKVFIISIPLLSLL